MRNFLFFYFLTSLIALGAVNSIQLQLKGTSPNRRVTIDRLLTEGTALVGDANNLPQVVDIVTQVELTSTLSGYQPVDSDLTSIAALSTTSFGRSLLELANAAALRSAAGLVIGTDVQAWDADLDDLADGSLTGTKVGFADTGDNFTATNVQAAIEELASVNALGPNATDGKVEWSQLIGVPAGFADGSDDGSGGGGGTMKIVQESGVQVGDDDIVTLNFGNGFDLTESPDTKINVTLDASEIFTDGDITWNTNIPSIGTGAVTSAKILDGTIVNADINASAAIALSKLAIDPLARANHTGTQTLSTISDAGTLAGLNSVASANITDGTIVNADINAAAGIALSKLASISDGTLIGRYSDGSGDPQSITIGADFLYGGGTLALATAYQPLNSDLTAIAALTTTAHGRGLLDDADAAASRATIGVGTSSTGTQASPNTTTPLAPTWTGETHIVRQGATGEIDLPAAAGYDKKALVVEAYATLTATVDPDGTEHIYVAGTSLGAGTADVTSMVAGQTIVYLSNGTSWRKLAGGSGGGSGFPLTDNADLAGFDLENGGNITAETFTGDLTGDVTATLLSATTATLGDTTVVKLATTASWVKGQTAGVSNVVVTGNAVTVITLNDTTATITFDETPATGTYFEVILEGHSADCVVTWPNTFCYGIGGNRTSFTAPANKPTTILVRRDASRYVMWGAPTRISDLSADTTPAIASAVEIDQGSGSERTSLANIRDLLGVTYSGTAATPNTTTPVSVAFDSTTFYHHCGDDQELDLPAASGYVGRGIVIRFGASAVATLDPNGSDLVTFEDDTSSSGDVLEITGTPGQVAIIAADAGGWFVAGGTASFEIVTP